MVIYQHGREKIEAPYVFLYTLNNEEQKSRRPKKFEDQDTEMPEYDDEPCYNYDSFMYCLCFRFNTLISTDKTPVAKHALL